MNSILDRLARPVNAWTIAQINRIVGPVKAWTIALDKHTRDHPGHVALFCAAAGLLVVIVAQRFN